MLSYDKKLFLIKTVDASTSDQRIKNFPLYIEKFGPISKEEITEISDLIYIREENIVEIIKQYYKI